MMNNQQTVKFKKIYFNNYLIIEIITKKIEVPLDLQKSIYLNIYEIPVDDNLLKQVHTIEEILFESQCTLFLFDITKNESFELIKKLINLIDFKKFPYMKGILLQNKSDEEKSSKVSEAEISILINTKNNLETLKISTKDKTGIDELLIKIDKAINENENELPMNIVSESTNKKPKLVNGQGYLSFLLIGDTEVGKTCFYNRYFKNKFSLQFLSTIGIERESKLVKIGKEIYKITLWDSAGQERFKSLPRKYYQNADGIFLLFDVCKEETFNNVSNWINDVKQNTSRAFGNKDGNESSSEIPLFLLGNKIDSSERIISREQGEKLASSLGMKYFEISCKTNINIPEVMSRMIMESYMKANHIDNCFRLSTTKHKKKSEKKACC